MWWESWKAYDQKKAKIDGRQIGGQAVLEFYAASPRRRSRSLTILEDQIAKLALDEFSEMVVKGALRVIADPENPIRLNLFAAEIRELYGHVIHQLAPDEEVKACAWFQFEEGQSKPTRRQRVKYATRGGLSDDFIARAGVEVEHLHDGALDAVDNLNKYTHVRPGAVVLDQALIEAFVSEAFNALAGLFQSFDECRKQIQDAVFEQVNEETISALISETIQSLDELATHHSVEDVVVYDVKIAAITHEAVSFVVTGTVEVGLQWGSNSDMRRGDGAELDDSFPFRVTMWSPVDNVTRFEDVEYVVDTSSWWENYYE